MDDNNVIHAFPVTELPENPLAIKPRTTDQRLFCRHEKITLDEHNRTVECAVCGATLNPFDYLISNAQTLQRAWTNHREVSRQVTELNDRLTELKKQEKNLTAQVRRRTGQIGVVATRQASDDER